jgi:hypothetical protein
MLFFLPVCYDPSLKHINANILFVAVPFLLLNIYIYIYIYIYKSKRFEDNARKEANRRTKTSLHIYKIQKEN